MPQLVEDASQETLPNKFGHPDVGILLNSYTMGTERPIRADS